MLEYDGITPRLKVINHGVRRLAYGFFASIVVGIILTQFISEEFRGMVGVENYGKFTVFISLFLPLFVNWIYNGIQRRILIKKEEKLLKEMSEIFTQDDVKNLLPVDKEMVEKSLDKRKHLLRNLKVLQRNQEDI